MRWDGVVGLESVGLPDCHVSLPTLSSTFTDFMRSYRKQGLDGIRNFGGFGTHLRLLLGGALGWYSVWFWIKGVVPGPAGLEPFGKFPEGQFCSLTKVRIFSRQITNPEVKYAALAISGGWLTYSVIICLSAPLAGVTRIMKMVSLFRSKQYANTTRLRFATGATERQ